MNPAPNPKVIFIVTGTICLCALVGVITGAVCIIYKIPDMNTTMSGWFTHVIDTIAGALIGMLINTRVSQNGKQNGAPPTPVQVVNPPSAPVPTEEQK
jgi:hypothetical protein